MAIGARLLLCTLLSQERVAELERRLAAMSDNVEALRRTTFHAARVAKKAAR